MEPSNLFGDIRVIGFDLDQTLYPKSPLIDEKIQRYLYEKIAEHAQVTLDAAELLFKERYRAGAGMSGRETLEDLGLSGASDLVQEALERADLASVLFPDEDTNKLLTEIRARYKNMDLITGSNKRQTLKKLVALDVPPETFSHIITDDQAAKSTGASYTLWLSLYPHLQSQQFLYIGDRVRSDHEIPSALGIQTLLIYVQNPDTDLPVTQLANISDLRPILL